MERLSLNVSQWLWWTERDSLLIAYYSETTDEFTSPSDVRNVHVLYVQRPDKFLIPAETPERDGFSGTDAYLEVALVNGAMSSTNYLNQVCEIPEQFHEALIARVIANGYERKAETIPLAQHFHMKYEQGVKLCKSYAGKGRDAVYGQLTPIDF